LEHEIDFKDTDGLEITTQFHSDMFYSAVKAFYGIGRIEVSSYLFRISEEAEVVILLSPL